ncbi:transmembrane protein 198 isoform X1 [Harmonia axyridis]|uniref:transmembrane protein 198 isoform X1 n=1 Tax=Harmonia axyridis TaxID=115357 RepID=UPI001E279D27|nr:transmembrane protein 198 isoform X1 [Harmonia axyridis]XP_045469852.1 transmembrane protein 198 isoform X1 [Harmonia axyridis]
MESAAQPGLLVPPRPNGTLFPIPGLPRDEPKVELCARVDTHYDLTTAAICCGYIMFGILYTFVGYRLFKTVMFLTGFIFASSLVYLMCFQGELMPPYGNAGVAILAGVLFGLITMLVQYVGLFMGGLHTGFLLGLAGLLTADHFMETSPKGSVWMCVGVLLASALLFAIFNLYFRKGLTILGTSVYGGAILTASMDYFVERLSMLAWLWQRVSLRPVEPPPCWFSWIVLGAWPSFVIVGLILQCAITGKGIHHDDIEAGRKKPRGPSLRGKTREERAEMRQKKYRYLYQVRTAHGDVISQNFVQALQKKESEVQGAGECSTLQSDATNLTILPDAHLSVLTESEDDSQIEVRNPRR